MSDDIIIQEITLPPEEYDEDDELDARLEKAEKKRKRHIDRGNFRGT